MTVHSTPLYTKEIVYDHEAHDYAMYLGGELAGYARSYHEAEATLDQLVFELMSGERDWSDMSAPARCHTCGSDGSPCVDCNPLPPAFPAAVDLTPVDFLARCADGEFVRDWAMIDHLAAHVRCAIRDTLPLSAPPLPSPDAPAGGDESPALPHCDVAGCGAPGEATWLGCVPRYPATSRRAHQVREVA